jgi:iron complex transport system ATP-binding protein
MRTLDPVGDALAKAVEIILPRIYHLLALIFVLMERMEERPLTAALIDFQNIRVMRGDKFALDDFTLRIAPSEHVAIIGPNGCGKSTLIKTITRECYPVARKNSKMTILGNERWNVFELRLLLGIVSNDLMERCKGDATGRDIVLSGFFSSTKIFDNHHVNPDQVRRADAVLDRLKVLHLAGRPLDEMSSGEAQRILIARALVHNPRALVFDEPSNSLDVLMQHNLRETMRELAQAGVGIVLVTHHAADIIPEIERVVLMSEGRVVADGRKKDLLVEDRMSSLFGFPVSISRRDGYYNIW